MMKATFVSYSRKDSDFALQLVSDLKQRGCDLWFDQFDIRPGLPWDDAIDQALLDCSVVVLLVSPQSLESQNVKDEYSYAIDNEKTLIPVIIEDARLPVRIHRLQYIDLRNNYEEGLHNLIERLPKSDDPNQFTVSRNSLQYEDTPITSRNLSKMSIISEVSFDGRVALWGNAIHPQKDIILFGGVSGYLNIWSLSDGKVKQVGNYGSIYNLRFSPDGCHIVISSENGDVSVLSMFDEANTYELRAKLKGHLATVFGSSFNYTSSLVATCGEDEFARIFALDGTLLHEEKSDLGQLFGVDFSRTSNCLYFTGESQYIYQFNADTFSLIEKWKGSDYSLYGVVVSPTRENILATYGVDRCVRLWQGSRLVTTLDHRGSTMWVSFHPTEPILAVGCYDNSLWIWDLDTQETITMLRTDTPVYNVTFNRKGSLLICTTTSGVTIRGIS